ncbi:MAG TPA: hypothetical protein VG759_15125 [Candidatus Angelobacter sp.]|nr:hypothetical protein [Candidatus Angelobacter sp.]
MVAAVKQAPEPENTRLTLGDYLADVLLDTRHDAKIFHWIVQKIGSASIIHWGQEHSFEDAKLAAQTYLESLNRSNKQKKA